MIKTPLNQQRQTNIAIVRMKIKNKKFEIPAYKNKVVSWRNGTEKDINEVLQMVHVYTNVSKGELAKREDLIKYFNDDSEKNVCITILNKGELQVSAKEREIMYESMYRDIVTIICNLCINPDTQRQYPPGMIDRALREMHFAVKPAKSAKKQALEVIRRLKKTIPIERAQMRLEILVTNASLSKKVKQMLTRINRGGSNGGGDDAEEGADVHDDAKIERDVYNPEDKSVQLTVLIDPGMFRMIDEFAIEHGDAVRVTMLDTTVLREGEERIDEILSEDDEEAEEADEAEGLSSELADKARVSSKNNKSSSQQPPQKKGRSSKKNNRRGAADSEGEEEEAEESNTRNKRNKGKKSAVAKQEKKVTKRQVDESEDDDEEEEPSTFLKGKAKKMNKKNQKLVAKAGQAFAPLIEVEEEEESEDEW